MSDEFTTWVEMARNGAPEFGEVSYAQRVASARAHLQEARALSRERHAGHTPGGEDDPKSAASGRSVLRLLTAAVDEVVCGAAEFGLYDTGNRRNVLNRAVLCAVGGYGRRELSPYSDLDICLVYDDCLDEGIETLHQFLVPFWWDVGFKAGYALYSVSEAAELAHEDPKMFTTFAQARILLGDNTTFSRLRLQLSEIRVREGATLMAHLRQREDAENLPPAHRDLFNIEPDIKENAGGLRDFHTALWMIHISQGTMDLEELQRTGFMSMEEYLEVSEALDFIWRIRNALHFETGKATDTLSFALQSAIAPVLGYAKQKRNAGQGSMDRLMQDYYSAAASLRRFLQIAARICDRQTELEFESHAESIDMSFKVFQGKLRVASRDQNWFAENPARLMQVFWVCAQHCVPLSATAQRRVRNNLWLVDDAFRSNYVVRRYFLAVCNRISGAGFALRQMKEVGLLAAYLPEFGDVENVLRYEDFHSYPVDEHTIRATEALAEISGMSGRVAEMLQETLEHVRVPHILLLAILLHDLGKAEGEVHVEAGARLALTIGERMGLHEDDIEQIEFLVRHHMLMNDIAMYRDTDDLDIVRDFAEKVRSTERLRDLLLLSYADLKAVGPTVWTEWKGALLLKLYLRTERILLGRDLGGDEAYWQLPKARRAIELLPESERAAMEDHIRGMGERYLVAFTPEEIAAHAECLEAARRDTVAVRIFPKPEDGVTDVVVCTTDHTGLFAQITGSFAAHLLDVKQAALFTSPDGLAVDCFTVYDAPNQRPPTAAQCANAEKVLRTVLIEGVDIRDYVEQSRRRLFALLQPRVPVLTQVTFDNDASRSDTVIDVITGDRTGLLYDIAASLAAMGVGLFSARIVTDARHARDAFYVRMGNSKIEDPKTQATLREGLLDAIERGSGADTKGVPA